MMNEYYSTYLSMDIFAQTVNDLPVDVLADIFEMVQQQHYLHLHNEGCIYAWTYVSWICQNWGWVALTSPRLWTKIWIETWDRSQCNLD